MIRRRNDSKIEIWTPYYINNQFVRAAEDKELEIEQIEPCGDGFIVEVFKNERSEE